MSDPGTRVTPFSILKSAFAAMLGVQSNENRERDFNSGKFWHFFVAGFVVTVIFMGLVWLAVKVLLSSV